jgi:hypothetical protein
MPEFPSRSNDKYDEPDEELGPKTDKKEIIEREKEYS